MLVEEALCHMGVHRIEFVAVMEIPASFDVFRKCTDLRMSTHLQFPKRDASLRFKVKTERALNPCARTEPLPHGLGINQCSNRSSSANSPSVNVNHGIPVNRTGVRHALLIDHPSDHARAGCVLMNVEQPPSIMLMPFLKRLDSMGQRSHFRHETDQHAQDGRLPRV